MSEPLEHECYAIKFGSLHYFRGNDKLGPVDKIPLWLIKKLGRDHAQYVYPNLIWSSDMGKKFEKMVLDDAIKSNPHLSKKFIKKNIPFNLMNAPVDYNCKWMKPGYFYIRKHYIEDGHPLHAILDPAIAQFDKDLEELLDEGSIQKTKI